jgi:uncharacterized protein (TIGR02996 family)
MPPNPSSSDSTVEAAFLRSIAEDPANAAATWLVLADWLEEHGDPRAELVRLCHDPRYRPKLSPEKRDDRIRALLAAGVRLCVPTLTNSIGMTFALIPAGKFHMGSPKFEVDRNDDEGPQHQVEITRAFYMGIVPVTQEQYEKVMHKNPSFFTRHSKFAGGPAHPVEEVSWDQAVEFCRKLSTRAKEKSSGREYRLPTEAEWEYACRGGSASSTPFHFGDSLSSTQANFHGHYPYGVEVRGRFLRHTTPVGSYNPNAFGLCDMHGNVWEWCQDWYGRYPRKPAKDPTGPASGARRVLRGGTWGSCGEDCRSARRLHGEPGYGSQYFGFRVVCSASPR